MPTFASASTSTSAAMNAPPTASSYLSTSLDGEYLDPTLDSCCAREILATSAKARATNLVKSRDTIMSKQRVIDETVNSFKGCKCCFVKGVDGGGYKALDDLVFERFQKRVEEEKEVGGDNYQFNTRKDLVLQNDHDSNADVRRSANENDSDSDSDDEFDYLLDSDLPDPSSYNTSSQNSSSYANFDDVAEIDITDVYADKELKNETDSRMQQLMKNAEDRERVMSHGYGRVIQVHASNLHKYVDIGGSTPKETYGYASPSTLTLTSEEHQLKYGGLIVLHLYSSTSTQSAQLDYHLENNLSSQHRGTRWLRCDGVDVVNIGKSSASNSMICRLLKSIGLDRVGDEPCLVAIKNGIVANFSKRLEAFGGYSSSGGDGDGVIATDAVNNWLHNCGVLEGNNNERDVIKLCSFISSSAAASEKTKDDDEGEEENYYDCGVPGCGKTFAHQHIGVGEGGEGAMIREGLDSIHL